MLMSPEGKVLNSDVSGKIIMKAFLTGMPECKFGLNDKLMMEAEHRKATGTRYKEIDIDDVTFHQVKTFLFLFDWIERESLIFQKFAKKKVCKIGKI